MAKVKNPFGEPEVSPETAQTNPTVKAHIERYMASAAKIEMAVEKLTVSKLKWKMNPKKWSIRETLCHLTDSEIIGAARIYLVIASTPDSPPNLVGYDQDRLIEKLHANSQDELLAIQTFKSIRRHIGAMLKSLPDSEFDKFGLHTERGKLTLADLVKHYADHAESHLKQIERIKEELSGYEI
jgi:hypothetical protein